MITLTPLTAGVLAGVIALCGIALGAVMAKAFDESQWGKLCTCGHHEMAHAKSGTCCFRNCKCQAFTTTVAPSRIEPSTPWPRA